MGQTLQYKNTYMILLVHSCHGREAFVDVWFKCFERSGWDVDRVIVIGGEDDFSDQLIRTLVKIRHCEYVWHILDDYFITKPVGFRPINFDRYWRLAHDLKVDALRIQPNVSYNSLPYRFRWEFGLLRQTNESEYQISMQCSIWRREFLLQCLTPGLDPWQQENSKKINKWPHEIYFVPELPFWHINGTIKGVLTKEGAKMK